jgi:hypothetical protein
VERAIRDGARYLKQQQKADGSWEDYSQLATTGTTRLLPTGPPEAGRRDYSQQAITGTTSLATLALLTTGEQPNSPTLNKALEYLRSFAPYLLNSTYAIALQTMVFASAEPERDQVRIRTNVRWLEAAQIKPDDPVYWPGSWTYSSLKRTQPGDNSNTQHALLGLNAASEIGVPVKPAVWALARLYWEKAQRSDGGWGYHLDDPLSTSSMTCAGIWSMIVTDTRRFQGQEYLRGALIHNCGVGGLNPKPYRGIDWLASHFSVGQNFPMGQQWKHYYLYGLERAGRLAGVRFFGRNDWYRLGAEELVRTQDRLSGTWRGAQENQIVATSFALLFLAKGRAPVLVNKLRHAPRGDWNNDTDDVANLVSVVARDRKTLLTWQVADADDADEPVTSLGPIVFMNGHQNPVPFGSVEVGRLREFAGNSGLILADACCSRSAFDLGFRQFMKQVFPSHQLRLLPEDHPVWHAKFALEPGCYPLWGIDLGGRTAVIYSPKDLSCYWNLAHRSPEDKAVVLALKVGQNIVEYATRGKNPPGKLTIREVEGKRSNP